MAGGKSAALFLTHLKRSSSIIPGGVCKEEKRLIE
jgi:hypothetical protein